MGMRVISQRGDASIPFDDYSFRVIDRGIVCAKDIAFSISEFQDHLIAEYSTKEKARKAIDMLHMAYAGEPVCIDISKIGENKLGNLSKDMPLFITQESMGKVESVGNIVFQFPQEDEIE